MSMSRWTRAIPTFAFDDITLLPRPNEGAPEGISLLTRVSRRYELPFPVLSAAMPSVTEAAMAVAIGEFGGLGVLHRFMALDQQCAMIREVAAHVPAPVLPTPARAGGGLLAAASCDPRDVERATRLAAAGARLLFLDTPNPDNAEVAAGVARIRRATDVDLVIGSVVNGETARRYIDIGVDAIKVGLGAGALCSIRRSAGVGLAQATALVRVVEATAPHDVPVISDGGVRCPGDIVKALALGASSVMVGSMLAGCDEAPGESFERDGRPMKRISGLRFADFELALPTGYPAVDAHLRSHPAPRVEGLDGAAPASGPCHLTLLAWMRSIRVGLQMSGARSIRELWSTAEFAVASVAELSELAGRERRGGA